jgi:hypothetical protein
MTLSTTSPGDEREELSSKQIEAGWHKTFSTSNPFCPCDLKSFTKAVRWAERALSSSTVQQVGADALDAARYRHLVATCNIAWEPSEPWQLVIWEPSTGEDWKAKLDAAIDAAIASSPKSEQGDQQ